MFNPMTHPPKNPIEERRERKLEILVKFYHTLKPFFPKNEILCDCLAINFHMSVILRADHTYIAGNS